MPRRSKAEVIIDLQTKAKQAEKDLKSYNKELGKLGAQQENVAKGSKKLSFAALEAARAFEDFQFAGLKGVVNNLTQLSTLLVGGLPGAILAVATVVGVQLAGGFDTASKSADKLATRLSTLRTLYEKFSEERKTELDEELERVLALEQARINSLKEQEKLLQQNLRLKAQAEGDQRTVDILDIQGDPSLTPAQKAERIFGIRRQGAEARRDASIRDARAGFRGFVEGGANVQREISERETRLRRDIDEIGDIGIRQAEAARALKAAREELKEAIAEASRAPSGANLTGRVSRAREAVRLAEGRENSESARLQERMEALNKSIDEQRKEIEKLNNRLSEINAVRGDQQELLENRVAAANAKFAAELAKARGQQQRTSGAAQSQAAEAFRQEEQARAAEAEKAAAKRARDIASQDRGLASAGRRIAGQFLDVGGVAQGPNAGTANVLAEQLSAPGGTVQEAQRLANLIEQVIQMNHDMSQTWRARIDNFQTQINNLRQAQEAAQQYGTQQP